MQGVLESLVIDTENDHNTKNTSRRVAKMYVQEVFNGRYVEQPVLTKFPNVSRLNELMIIGPITCAAPARTTSAQLWAEFGLAYCQIKVQHSLVYQNILA